MQVENQELQMFLTDSESKSITCKPHALTHARLRNLCGSETSQQANKQTTPLFELA
jgi:hypothetical protein